jgi:wyosine [tRNA(Phe)-imidazoG37] synthetase (radical SAM superfamily)
MGRYLVVDRIEFVVTYLCNSKCSHCQLAEEEKNLLPGHIDKDKASEIIRKVCEAYTQSEQFPLNQTEESPSARISALETRLNRTSSIS